MALGAPEAGSARAPSPEDSFAAKRPLFEAFTTRLEGLIRELLSAHSIEVAQVTSRCKTVASFREKSQRPGKHYADPLQEITDLVGVRVIAYYQEDVPKIGHLLAREFALDVANSVEKGKAEDPDRFGYSSHHYVVTLPSRRTRLPEWKPFRGLSAEIQVRTILQHAWAEIDHKLQYKTSGEVPRTIRRQLYRLSALLELGDKEFSEVRKLKTETERDYQRSIHGGILSLDLDASSLRIFVDQSPKVKALVRQATKAGFRPSLPPHPKSIPLLLECAKLANLRRLSDLETVLDARLDWTPVFAEIRKETEKASFTPVAQPPDLLAFAILLTKKIEPTDLPIDRRFRPELDDAIRRVGGLPPLKGTHKIGGRGSKAPPRKSSGGS